MKFQTLTVLAFLFSMSCFTQAANTLEGSYEGRIEGRSKSCKLDISYNSNRKTYTFEAYRSKKERRKLSEKANFWMNASKVKEDFNSGYDLYMNTIPSESSSMMNWMIGREAKTYILQIGLDNEMGPKSVKLSSKRSSEKIIFNCINLKKK